MLDYITAIHCFVCKNKASFPVKNGEIESSRREKGNERRELVFQLDKERYEWIRLTALISALTEAVTMSVWIPTPQLMRPSFWVMPT